MTSLEIYNYILEKLISRYNDLSKLRTNNDSLHTRIFLNATFSYQYSNINVLLDTEELPILECLLPNGNYALMSTVRIISRFQGIKYELSYRDYLWHDKELFAKSLPFSQGKSKVFKYYSKNKQEFFYEVDSFEPADACHNCILYQMRKIYA